MTRLHVDGSVHASFMPVLVVADDDVVDEVVVDALVDDAVVLALELAAPVPSTVTTLPQATNQGPSAATMRNDWRLGTNGP